MTRSPRKARIISRPTLNDWKTLYPDAADALDAWEQTITELSFHSFFELHQQINTVDFVNGDFLVFNIMGNRYRLIATAYFPHPAIYLKLFLTHREYDAWSRNQRTRKPR